MIIIYDELNDLDFAPEPVAKLTIKASSLQLNLVLLVDYQLPNTALYICHSLCGSLLPMEYSLCPCEFCPIWTSNASQPVLYCWKRLIEKWLFRWCIHKRPHNLPHLRIILDLRFYHSIQWLFFLIYEPERFQ